MAKTDADVCGICLEPPAVARTTTLCRHLFCTECLEKWRARKDSCPMCRKKLGIKKKPLPPVPPAPPAHVASTFGMPAYWNIVTAANLVIIFAFLIYDVYIIISMYTDHTPAIANTRGASDSSPMFQFHKRHIRCPMDFKCPAARSQCEETICTGRGTCETILKGECSDNGDCPVVETGMRYVCDRNACKCYIPQAES